jgi:hypothetical protein
MNLGVRAALSVPLIALLIGVVTALFSVAFEGNNALIKGWSLARITFVYAVIIALPIGVVLSFPAVLFGHFLPQPRRVWLIGIGAAVGSAPFIVMAATGASDFSNALLSALVLAPVGAFVAALWWQFVERHREETVSHD